MDDIGNKWGLLLDYGLRWPLSTSVSEGGLGHEAGLSFTINPTLEDRYLLKLIFPWGNTRGMLFPSTGVPGTYTDNFHWSVMLGMGHHHRMAPFFDGSGGIWGAVYSQTTPLMGFGSTTSGLPDRTVGGQEYSFGESDAYTFDISTQYSFGVEFMPVDHFQLQIAPTLNYGLYYAGEASEWNRMNIEFMIMAAIGYGDNSHIELHHDREATSWEISYRTYAKLHGIVQSVLMNKVLNDLAETIVDYGMPIGGRDPGSTEDLRFLQAASGFLGGMGQAASMEYFWRVGSWNPLPLALEGAGGILLIALADGNSGRGAGTGDLFNALGMSIYMMMGADTPAEREALGDRENSKLLTALLIREGINALGFLIGGLVVNENAESDFGWTLLSGTGGANFGLAFTPAPSDSDTIARTTYSYIPASYYGAHLEDDLGEFEMSGSRSGFLITNSLNDWPLYTETMFLSHAVRLDNVFKRMGVDSNSPYGDASLPSEIRATLGVQYEMTWFRIGAGLSTGVQFGSGMGGTALLGATAGIDALIPFNGRDNGTGLTLGLRAGVNKLFPTGWDYEIAPHLGLTAHF